MNKYQFKNQAGFTLIELIVVIVILGILAAVAVPKFINMKEEAFLSAMDGLVGAINSAATLTYAKAIISGVETEETATIEVDGHSVELVYGFPATPPRSDDASSTYGLKYMIETPSGWSERHSSYDGAWVYWPEKISDDAGVAQCYIRYRQPTSAGSRPVIDVQTSGCSNY